MTPRSTAKAHKAWLKGPLYLYHISLKDGYGYGVVEHLRFQMVGQATSALRMQSELQTRHEKDPDVKLLMHVRAEAGDTFLVVDGSKLPANRARKVLRRPLNQICHLLEAVVKVQLGNSKRLVIRARPEFEWDVNEFPFYLYHEQTGGVIAPRYFKTTLEARDAVAEHLRAMAGDKEARRFPIRFTVNQGDSFLVLNRVQIQPKNANGWVKSGYGSDSPRLVHSMVHVVQRTAGKFYARTLPPNQRRPNMRAR